MNAVQIKRLSATATLPFYATPGAAGMDLHADLGEVGAQVILAPGERRLVKTGLAIALPSYLEAQVRPRSGLALKAGVTVLNSPGTVDSDYRGDVGVILYNASHQQFVVKHGERIAQLVISPIVQAELVEVETLDETDRGAGGFGSTGVQSVLQEKIALPSGLPMSVNAVASLKMMAQEATDRRRVARWVEAEPREAHPEDAQ